MNGIPNKDGELRGIGIVLNETKEPRDYKLKQ